MKLIRIYMRHCPALAVLKIFFFILSGVAMPLGVLGLGKLINSIQAYQSFGTGGLETLLWAGITVLPIVLAAISQYLNNFIDIKIKRKLSVPFLEEILDKLCGIKYEYFEASNIRDAINRLGKFPDEKTIELFGQSLSIISAFISLVGFLLGYIYIAPISGLIAPFVLGAMLYFDYRAASGMNQVLNEQSPEERQMQYFGSLLVDKNALFELRAFNAVSFILRKWKCSTQKVLSKRLHVTIRSEFFFAISFGLSVIWAVLTIGFGYTALKNKTIDAGLFVAFIIAIESVAHLSTTTGQQLTRFMRGMLEFKNYNKIMSLSEIEDGGIRPILEDAEPFIVFDDVSFSYPGASEMALSHVSFVIKRGMKTAIVGENGAGKSTILKLLAGLYVPTEGTILVYGVPLEKIPPHKRLQLMSIIFQDAIPYALPFRDNISMAAREHATDDQYLMNLIGQYAPDLQQIGLDDFLGKLDERGIDLSGGQWAKINVLRAICPNPECVILDEPTAAFDAASENVFYEEFVKNSAYTQIIITHRLAAARLADQILVMKQGELVERGSHDTLMAKDTLYQEMFKKQQSWYVGEEVETHEAEA